MPIVRKDLQIDTKPDTLCDITGKVSEAVRSSGLSSGIVSLFVPGSTGALTTIEYEPGACSDFIAMLERTAPEGIYYKHHEKWHDDNGRSHVKASLVGPSLCVPFEKGELLLGTWQQIVFVELDTSDRTRRIIAQIVGE